MCVVTMSASPARLKFLLTLLVATAASGAPTSLINSALPINLDAQSSDFDYRNNLLLFRHVKISQGDTSVQADEATATGLRTGGHDVSISAGSIVVTGTGLGLPGASKPLMDPDNALRILRDMPVHKLKIDQSFVRDMATNPRDASIVGAIVALTRSLALQSVAEGIETQAQSDMLRDAGCMAGQGFLFQRPVPASEFGRIGGSRPA